MGVSNIYGLRIISVIGLVRCSDERREEYTTVPDPGADIAELNLWTEEEGGTTFSYGEGYKLKCGGIFCVCAVASGVNQVDAVMSECMQYSSSCPQLLYHIPLSLDAVGSQFLSRKTDICSR